MAVVGVAIEKPDSPKGDFTLNEHKITRTFLVQTNNIMDGVLTVTAAVGIPRLFQIYTFGTEIHSFCRCRNITAERIEPRSYWWVVTAEYETPSAIDEKGNYAAGARQEKSGQEDNPLLEWPTLDMKTETFQQVVYGVYDSVTGFLSPCKNSAGEVFDPAPKKDASRCTLTFSQNLDINAPIMAQVALYQDAVNSDPFGDWCGVGQAKVMSINANRATKQLANSNVFAYLRVTTVVQIRPTWDLFILDSGNYYIDSITGKKIKFVTSEGHPVQGPLDGLGHQGGPVYLQYRLYQRMPFAALQLPPNFASVG